MLQPIDGFTTSEEIKTDLPPMRVVSKNFLSPSFLRQYDGVLPKNKGLLFEVVYLRTYSRWVESLKRRETWHETIQRVVEYSMKLSGLPMSYETIKEAENLYDKMFHLKLLPAGRSLWIGGTKAAELHPEANFNCSFIAIDGLECFGELFHLLLCGCGVGFSVMPEDIAKLPNLHEKQVFHYDYVSKPKVERSETTDYTILNKALYLQIGDSKEAWVEALNVFLNAYTTDAIKDIWITYDSIRPAGERIETFGGKAAGPDGMRDMFSKVTNLLNRRADNGAKLTPVDCVDLCNLIAKNVIVGGTRRSSEIALGHPDDKEFMDAKLVENFKANPHRNMSNNSIAFMEVPSIEKLNEMFDNIHNNGEPGFFNLAAAQRRRPNARGLNPCAEILLDSRGFCNLSTVVMTSHVDENGKLDYKDLADSVRLATRIGVRMTTVTVTDPKWDFVQKRDRLIGVSMTGWMDLLDLLDVNYDSDYAKAILKTMRYHANAEADTYSEQLGISRPLLVTTVKPEGTLSQLPTVSSGLHRGYAPYYIRRIRVSKLDSVASALLEKGVPHVVDPYKEDRLIFEFPVKTNTKVAANDEPALDQLERYFIFQENYTDHNSSCTLTLDRSETEEVVKKVHERFDDIIGIAWLSKSPVYPLMPYEQINKEEYDRRAAVMLPLDDLHELVNKYENEQFHDEPDDDPACSTGACPIR